MKFYSGDINPGDNVVFVFGSNPEGRHSAGAAKNPDKDFCIAYRNTAERSLNGYTGLEMIRMFLDAGPVPDNIVVSEEWYRTGLFVELKFRK